jgi:hypothetical protein
VDDHIEPYFSLAEAAAKFFPGGKITARSLRTEIENGYLPRIKIAGKLVVSASAIARLLELKRREAEGRLKPVPRRATRYTLTELSDIERKERARAGALFEPTREKRRRD